MVSYYRRIVTLCLKCTVFEIWRHIVENRRKNRTHPHLATFLWGDPLRIFRRLIPCQKLVSWGYQMVYISRSCFRSARHNTGVWQTDGRLNTLLSQRPHLHSVARVIKLEIHSLERGICPIDVPHIALKPHYSWHLTSFVDANNNSQPTLLPYWSHAIISHVTTWLTIYDFQVSYRSSIWTECLPRTVSKIRSLK